MAPADPQQDDFAQARARGADRSRRAQRTAVLAVAYQGVIALSQLAALALLARHLGKDLFGLWMTILAFSSWAPIAYAGQPSALMSKLGVVALIDEAQGLRIFTASMSIVLGVTAVLGLLALAIAPWLNWPAVLNASSPLAREAASPTAWAALIIAFLGMPATMANFAIIAHQRGAIVHLAMIGGSIVAFGAFATAVLLGEPLKLTGPLMVAGPLLGGLALWAAMTWIPGLASPPSRRALDRRSIRMMGGLGLHFLAIEATTLALVRTPDVIVAQLHGSEAVATFAAVGRLPMLLLAVFQSSLLPYWPALAEALNRGDVTWARQVVRRSLPMVLASAGACAVGLMILGPPLVRLWLGVDDPAIPGLVMAACGQALGMAALAWLAVVFGALEMFRQQLAVLLVCVLVFVPMALTMGSVVGPAGVAWSQAAALVLVATPLAALLIRRRLASTDANAPIGPAAGASEFRSAD